MITHEASKQWGNKTLAVWGCSSAVRRLAEPLGSLGFNPQKYINGTSWYRPDIPALTK